MKKITDMIFELKMKIQRFNKGFSDADCWDLEYWLTTTFPKMIQSFRDRNCGVPIGLDLEEVDNFPIEWLEAQSQILLKQKRDKQFDEEIDLFGENKIFDRWWLILSRIAYCLEKANGEDYLIENEFAGEFYDKSINGNLDIELRDKHFNRELEVIHLKDDMMKEAFNLIQKYFWHLWY